MITAAKEFTSNCEGKKGRLGHRAGDVMVL